MQGAAGVRASVVEALVVAGGIAEDGQAPFGNGGDECPSDTVVRAVHRTLHWAKVVEVKDEEVVMPGALFAEA
ncbi:hypothetical protein ACIQ7Q_31490 [Streptomyces sp. NPDC096176]|uniref:hypothetical protein n=1 Tax=Streptomyces sp. NPDC096176 TaxID=3366079 RepID=UPI003808EBE6